LLEKHAAFLVTVALSSLLFGASVSLLAVFGWSNGGYSDDPSNPKSHFLFLLLRTFIQFRIRRKREKGKVNYKCGR